MRVNLRMFHNRSNPLKNLIQTLPTTDKFFLALFDEEQLFLSTNVHAELFKDWVASQRFHDPLVERSEGGSLVLLLLLLFLSRPKVIHGSLLFHFALAFAASFLIYNDNIGRYFDLLIIVEEDLHDLVDLNAFVCFGHL